MLIQVRDTNLFDQKVDCFIYMVAASEKEFALPQELVDFAARECPQLQAAITTYEFTGAASTSVPVHFVRDRKSVTLLVVGLGVIKKGLDGSEIEPYRRALGSALRTCMSYKHKSVALALPTHLLSYTRQGYLAEQTAVIARMTEYHFDQFMTDKKNKQKGLGELMICVTPQEVPVTQSGVDAGEIIATAVNTTRHWIDMPPSQLTPPQLADKALSIAKKNGIKITTYNEKEIIAMGMGGLAGVSVGSDIDCAFVILEYTTSKPGAPTLGFVGKGITFDSGGLSIKPAKSMETMKSDMSGAAAVINAMEAIAQLKLEVNIIAVTPLSENLPSGKATKPGDVLRFYNGKTAEVRNTDAEGRLILADALSYITEHYKLDVLVDLATLTGACAYALGPFFSGLMSQHEDLVKHLETAAYKSGDRVWRLPFDNDYEKAVASSMADLCNIGDPKYCAYEYNISRLI